MESLKKFLLGCILLLVVVPGLFIANGNPNHFPVVDD
jgi:hypothetical protein